MANGLRSGLAWAAIGLVGAASAAPAQQVIERDSKLTGPRGRTIERDIRVERGPGYVDRKIEIKRPGGTLTRDTRIENHGGQGGHGGHHPQGHGPGFGGPSRVVERDYFVEREAVRRPPSFSTFVGAPFFSLFLGNASPPPPPPPVIFYPEPVFVPPPPPMVVYPQPWPPPQVIVQAPPPEPADPLADALGRLRSYHGNSRRDGALTLGRIGDDRAVGPLIDRLEHDGDKEVRVAAAWALGEIGDGRSALPIQRAAMNDRKHEVREAATIAYRKLPRPGQEPDTSAGPVPVPPQSRVIRSQPEVIDAGPNRAAPDDLPPPPPVPAGPALEAPIAPREFRDPS